jgi:hypothetical protein
MTDYLDIYPLVLRGGSWVLPWGEVATPAVLAGLFGADCSVVFLGPDGGSFAYDVDEDGTEMIRLDYGPWQPLTDVDLSGWRADVLVLVLDAVVLI